MKGVQKTSVKTSIHFITFWGLKEKGQNVLLVSQWMYVPFRLIEGCGGYRRWGGLGATKTGVPPTQCMQCLSKSTHFSSHGFLESYHTLEYVPSTHHVSSAHPSPYSCESSQGWKECIRSQPTIKVLSSNLLDNFSCSKVSTSVCFYCQVFLLKDFAKMHNQLLLVILMC